MRRLDAPAVAVVCLLVLVLAVPAMAATHAHDAGHSHDEGNVAVVADGGHTHTDLPVVRASMPTLPRPRKTPTGTIISLDDPRLTSRGAGAGERRCSSDTRLAMASSRTRTLVVAAGYKSIGDGRLAGVFEHFVNSAFMTDGRGLDPHAIESIVLERQPDGTKTVVSAMYIL